MDNLCGYAIYGCLLHSLIDVIAACINVKRDKKSVCRWLSSHMCYNIFIININFLVLIDAVLMWLFNDSLSFPGKLYGGIDSALLQ